MGSRIECKNCQIRRFFSPFQDRLFDSHKLANTMEHGYLECNKEHLIVIAIAFIKHASVFDLIFCFCTNLGRLLKKFFRGRSLLTISCGVFLLPMEQVLSSSLIFILNISMKNLFKTVAIKALSC